VTLTAIQEHALHNISPPIINKYGNIYRGYVEKADLEQEMALWILQHPKKLEEWAANVEGPVVSDKAIATALVNVAKTYCIQEKGRREGLTASERAYLDKREDLKVILDAVFSKPWADGPWVDTLIDCETALKQLSGSHLQILFDIHLGGLKQKDVAEQLGVVPSTVAKRYDDALRALHEILQAPDAELYERGEYTGRRRVLSNVQAKAATGRGYEDA